MNEGLGLLDRKIRNCDAFIDYLQTTEKLKGKKIHMDKITDALSRIWSNTK